MSTFKAAEHEGWSSRAQRYDQFLSTVTRQAIEPILTQSQPLEGRHVLDICCGTGDLVKSATDLGACATGLDFAEPMIDVAKAKYPELRFQWGDAEALPFGDGSFDIVTCSFGLWHMPDPDLAIAEAARVLRPGGCFTYTTWLPPEQGWDVFDLVASTVTRFGSKEVQLPAAPPPFRFADERLARDALSGSGLIDFNYLIRTAHTSVETGQDVLDVIDNGTVRAAMLVDLQPTGIRDVIRSEISKNAEQRRVNGSINLRWPYVIVTGRKPKLQ